MAPNTRTATGDRSIDPVSRRYSPVDAPALSAMVDVRALLTRPVVLAPMGGGPSTPGLVAAGADAGAFGFLAAAYETAAQLRDEIEATRRLTSAPFGVNVFVPGRPTS